MARVIAGHHRERHDAWCQLRDGPASCRPALIKFNVVLYVLSYVPVARVVAGYRGRPNVESS
eukprot:7394643-Alexandrium_andersonii.AAC.1